MSKKILAFDFGASGGRAMLGGLEGGKLTMEEIHRFSNDPVEVNGVLYWDVLRLFFEIKQAIIKAKKTGFDAIGIDTWGVDFGLLDESGNLLENPVHYRDKRTENIMEEVFEILPKDYIYGRTGIQFMRFNTLFQLYYLKKYRPQLLERAKSMLFMPDLLAYFLTGKKAAEYTIASTSQMLNAKTRDWDGEILDKLGIDKGILCGIVKPGSVYGDLSDDICGELGCEKVPVIAVCGHDTASAVAATPSKDKDFVYISCGTWSLFGTETQNPVINDKAYEYQFTNEGGYNGTVRLLKNIMGLWILQECRRQWIKDGTELSYDQIAAQADKVENGKFIIDCDYGEFDKPGNMPQKIQSYCRHNNLPVPQTIGEIAKCVYESLAIKYKLTLDMLSDITGIKYSSVNLIGGGSQSDVLCRLAAQKCGLPVTAGPVEATVLGNIAVALIALGEIKDIESARSIIADSFKVKEYLP
jgi:rhamnulokinase